MKKAKKGKGKQSMSYGISGRQILPAFQKRPRACCFSRVADVLTPGLWEVVGTRVETIASGGKMTVKAFYHDNLYAIKVDVFTENKNTGMPLCLLL